MIEWLSSSLSSLLVVTHKIVACVASCPRAAIVLHVQFNVSSPRRKRSHSRERNNFASSSTWQVVVVVVVVVVLVVGDVRATDTMGRDTVTIRRQSDAVFVEWSSSQIPSKIGKNPFCDVELRRNVNRRAQHGALLILTLRTPKDECRRSKCICIPSLPFNSGGEITNVEIYILN